MSGDIHICGSCKQQFSTIEGFLDHKSKKCAASSVNGGEIHLPCSLHLNEGLSLEHSDTHHNENIATLTVPLLGSAATTLESSPHDTQHNYRTTVERSPYHRGLNDDEEDVADVLANQLSSMVSAQVLDYEHTSLHTETETVPVSEDFPQEMERVLLKIDKKNIDKIMKKPEKKKDKKPQKTFKCLQSGCTYEGRYYKDLARHTRIHTGERPYECSICGHTFSRADKLKLHLRIHSGHKPFKCQSCDYAAVDRSSLQKHNRTHTNERPCVCQFCPYRARDTSQLIVHLRTHTGDSPFVCLVPNCEAAFKTSSDLKRHTKLHTNEKPFACGSCDFRTRIKGNLLAHMRRAHLGIKKYPCNLCDTFVAHTHSALLQHKKRHKKVLLRCTVGKCDYLGVNVAAIRYHMRSKHPGECPQLTCKHCSFSCSQNSEMRSHIKTEHAEHFEEQKNKSKKSDKSIKKKKTENTSNLKRIFNCSICSVSFVREDSLRSHVRVHERANTGQKGVVVVDTSIMNEEDPDDPDEVPPPDVLPLPTVTELSPQPETTTQQVVFYVPHSQGQDPLLLSPNSGNNLIEQLNLQHGLQYILVPSTTESFEAQATSHNYQQ